MTLGNRTCVALTFFILALVGGCSGSDDGKGNKPTESESVPSEITETTSEKTLDAAAVKSPEEQAPPLSDDDKLKEASKEPECSEEKSIFMNPKTRALMAGLCPKEGFLPIAHAIDILQSEEEIKVCGQPVQTMVLEFEGVTFERTAYDTCTISLLESLGFQRLDCESDVTLFMDPATGELKSSKCAPQRFLRIEAAVDTFLKAKADLNPLRICTMALENLVLEFEGHQFPKTAGNGCEAADLAKLGFKRVGS